MKAAEGVDPAHRTHEQGLQQDFLRFDAVRYLLFLSSVPRAAVHARRVETVDRAATLIDCEPVGGSRRGPLAQLVVFLRASSRTLLDRNALATGCASTRVH
jgi:hypothetical protein